MKRLSIVLLLAGAAVLIHAAQEPPNGATAALSPDWYDEDEWHLLVRYLITPQETAAYRRLETGAAREAFIAGFWARRDPTPRTPVNEFQEEFTRRVDYANAHFTNPDDVPHTGLETDRGRVYITFGAPGAVQTFPSGAFELWRYERSADHPAMTFKFSLPVISTCDGSYRVETPAPLATWRSGTTAIELFPDRFVTARIRTDFTAVSSIAHQLRTAAGQPVLEADAPFWDGQIGPAGKDPLSRHILGCRMFESGGMGFTHPLPPDSYVFTSTITAMDGRVRTESVRFVVR